MRGKEVGQGAVERRDGITPACAGKSTQYFPACSCIWDHPRVCGEKCLIASHTFSKWGSPPRVRGKGVGAARIGCGVGITPACTGKRCGCSRRLPERRDHPRVCGEKYGPSAPGLRRWGSPPRVQGKAVPVSPPHYNRGITPAYAGKSSIQHLTASLGEFEVQKGHPVPHLRQRLQVWPDHARHLRHGLILHASLSAGQGRRLCPGPCPDTAGSGTPRGPSPAKRPHTSPPAATPCGCRAWQSGATAPGSR